jgi:hypothetical protein
MIGDGGAEAVASAVGTMPCLETLMWVTFFLVRSLLFFFQVEPYVHVCVLQ